jgi:hypothetical protein
VDRLVDLRDSVKSVAQRWATTRPVLPGGVVEWLDRPVRPFAIILGWIGSTITFLLVATALGGPTEGDSAEVVYGTWAIAHGRFACVYPVVPAHAPTGMADPFALAAPLYPLLTGLVSFVARIGRSVRFPSAHVLGPGCAHGFNAIFHWSVRSSAILPTVRLGYVAWVFVLAGVVYLARSTNLRNTGWEVAAGFAVALVPPVVMCLTYYFHPQDLLAEGLILAATGAFVRRHFLTCGILLGLALTAQQFAILAAIVLCILAGREGWRRLSIGAAVTVAVIDGPFVVVSGLRAVKTVLLGSSRVGSSAAAHGGTVMFTLGLRGIPDFLVSRILPILAAAGVAWWVARTWRGRDVGPMVVVSTVTAGLLSRLAFEVNLFGYYFLAGIVGVVLVEVLRRQVGFDVLALLGLFVVYMNPEHVSLVSNLTTYALSLFYDIPIAVMAIAVALLLYDALRRRLSVGLVVWIAFVALAGETDLWNRYNPIVNLPEWCWQIVLVGYAILIVARRLRVAHRQGDVHAFAPSA